MLQSRFWPLPVATLLPLLVLCPQTTHGQQGQDRPAATPIHLDSLLEELQLNNPLLLASRLEADAMATKERQVSALPDPMFMFGYQPWPILTGYGEQRTQWRVEQAIPFPGKLGLRGSIASHGADVTRHESATFGLDLALDVKQAYYELYRIQQQDSLILSFQERLQGFVDNAAMRYRVGEGMQQEILKAQLESNTLSRIRLDLVARRRTTAETLARLLDRASSRAFLADVRVDPAFPTRFDQALLLETAMRERPEVHALVAAKNRAEAQIELAEKDFYPDFGLNATYFDIAAADAPPTATGRDALAIGASIKIPLQRGRLKAKKEEAEVRRRQVDARQEALETGFRTQIADLVTRLLQEERQLELYQDALIPQAETTLQATLSAYTTGRTDFLDLLDAERMLFSLHTGLEDALARYLKMSASLERALGIRSLTELVTQ